MTSAELEKMLNNIDLQSASNEELSNIHSILNIKLVEVSNVMIARKHFKHRSTPKDKKAE